jgi:hypothetical protein
MLQNAAANDSPPWKVHGGLVSLLDMLEYVGFPLGPLQVQLREMDLWLKPIKSGNASGPGVDKAFYDLIVSLEIECNRLGLKTGARNAETIREHLDAGATAAIAAFNRLGFLQGSIAKDLKDQLFFYVAELDAVYYQDPGSIFPKTVKSFPSSRNDIRDACRCYSLDQGSACVFHCMGVLQSGLYALAIKLDAVPKNKPLQLVDWGKIIKLIKAQIENFGPEPSQSKTQEVADLETFYSQAATQFRYFKDAWRNQIAHLRESYERDDARIILMHVRDFMEHLSGRLTELPVPPINTEP